MAPPHTPLVPVAPRDAPPPVPVSVWRRLLFRGLRLGLVFVVLGWFYDWAAPRAYPKSPPPGFGYGTLHGALMPMALPSLLLGLDVPIYSDANQGRPYKIGYIVGINVCGLVVFGAAFARPRSLRSTSSEKSR